ncbi:uncharacterized protein [Rutidosis leptorrhynchoides]|uniref:uncharacterized protein n=1 Tax=Rutidosis leptorrhynchoides TaxID=125765 RepID=UPI003A99F1D4
MDWYKRKKNKLMIFKDDFEKAYDSVRWEFLDHMFVSLGFGDTWRGLIQMCLHSARTSVLVNGSPTGEFNLFRGLRQGDSLSPYLFLLVMEGLRLCLKEKVDSGEITGASIGSDVKISHLFYADDVVIISDWNRDGLLNSLQDYLWGANMKRITSWNVLKDRFLKKLSGCKVNLLSIGGRLTLIKSVLGSLDRFVNSSWTWVWNRSNIGETNEATVHELHERLTQVVFGEGIDSWIWSLSDEVGYSVSNTRSYIDDFVLPSASLYTMWVKQVPRKINIFIWRLALDRLPTRFNLSRRGLEIESIGCVSCNHFVESIHHIMFDCEVAYELWRRVLIWTNVLLPSFSEWTDWIAWFEDWRESEDVKSRLSRGKNDVNWNDWRVKPLSFGVIRLLRGNVAEKNECSGISCRGGLW